MRTSLTLFIVVFFIGGILSAQARNGIDYAFLFYNTHFTNGWTALPDTEPEAMELAKELQGNYNFLVETFSNLTLSDMRDRLKEINSRSFGPNDQVLFYFSSHGFYNASSDNGYLIPSDGPHEWNFGEGWLRYAELREYLAENGAKHVLLALDACYSGSFGRKFKGPPGGTPWSKEADCQTIQRSSLKLKSRLFFTSGNKEERTPAQSEFLGRWLQCLRERPQRGFYAVSHADLSSYINTVSSSTPESGSFNDHKDGGGFVFLHKDVCENGPPIPAATVDADTRAWNTATERHTREAYRAYLALHPSGKHATAATQALRNLAVPPDDMTFVPGGTFEMGNVFGGVKKDEKPPHTVTLGDFYLGKTEVTVAEFDAFVADENYRTDAEINRGSELYSGWSFKKMAGVNWRHDENGKERPRKDWNKPVIHVSWNDAVNYCNWRSKREQLTPVYRISGSTVTADWSANGYRLPTEAEWEYAARSKGRKEKWAGTSTMAEIATFANYDGTKDGHSGIAPVGSLKPNGLGLSDMSGNVYEWIWDGYLADYYAKSPSENPHGPDSAANRVLRGGSWDLMGAAACTVFTRNARPSDTSNCSYGFRVARIH